MKRYGNFEEILRDVGSLGRYQWVLYALMQYSNFLEVFNQNFMAFGKIEPSWRCNMTSSNESVSEAKPMSCPNFSICQQIPDEELHFYSQVREWGLYCDLSYVPMFIVSMQMFGIMPGAVVFSHLIDNYGRKWPVVLLNAGVLVLGLSSSFVDRWQMFAAIRFLIGFLFGGLFMVTSVIQMEVVKENDRMSFYALDCWPVASVVLALLAYLTHSWRRLSIVTNCMCIPMLFLLFWIRESPRWLIQKQRYQEAADILNYMAKCNRKKIRIEMQDLVEMVENNKQPKKGRVSFLDVFHSKQSAVHFLTLSYAWLALGCVTYGLVYQNTAYTGNPFVNFAAAAALRILTQVGFHKFRCQLD